MYAHGKRKFFREPFVCENTEISRDEHVRFFFIVIVILCFRRPFPAKQWAVEATAWTNNPVFLSSFYLLPCQWVSTSQKRQNGSCSFSLPPPAHNGVGKQTMPFFADTFQTGSSLDTETLVHI